MRSKLDQELEKRKAYANNSFMVMFSTFGLRVKRI